MASLFLSLLSPFLRPVARASASLWRFYNSGRGLGRLDAPGPATTRPEKGGREREGRPAMQHPGRRAKRNGLLPRGAVTLHPFPISLVPDERGTVHSCTFRVPGPLESPASSIALDGRVLTLAPIPFDHLASVVSLSLKCLQSSEGGARLRLLLRRLSTHLVLPASRCCSGPLVSTSCFRLFLEPIGSRTGLGCIPRMNGGSRWNLQH